MNILIRNNFKARTTERRKGLAVCGVPWSAPCPPHACHSHGVGTPATLAHATDYDGAVTHQIVVTKGYLSLEWHISEAEKRQLRVNEPCWPQELHKKISNVLSHASSSHLMDKV